ncbi:MATE family efflux transporter [Clostridium oryzae]|uniref:Probable multidrug resistance protein NorM n=1 Tax=Clostridium oryzae TaxID=1450648 RepID=A0A1V4IVT0_9CLOT|nr:MATE family efflux transporter [Clostridium oryzae]OPJ64151.1 multidrug export protein MepA [Clostridium oryzae]
MKNFKTIDFTEGYASKNLIAITVPLIIAYVFNMAYNIVDSLWIGNLLGEKALAALTVSTPLILLFSSLSMGATNAIAMLLSKYIGAKDEEKIKSTIATSFIVTLIFGVILVLICELGIDGILSALNTPKSIYSMAKGFLSIYVLGFIFVLFYLYFTAVLRSYGNSTMQMVSIIACTFLNLVIDPVFIHMFGMNGAAVATLISQGIMMLIMVAYIVKNKIIRIDIKLISKSLSFDIIAKSIPSMIQQSIPAISTAFITLLVAGFGVLSVAAFGISGKLEVILFYPAMALNMAITSCTGQCFGAKKMKKAEEYLKWGIVYGGILLIILTITVVFFAKELTAMFGGGTSVANIVKVYFATISIGYICNCITSCVLGKVNGFGRPTTAMFVMIFYYVVVRMPLAKIFSLSSLGLNGIWIAVLISHIAAVLASLIYNIIFMKVKETDLQQCA